MRLAALPFVEGNSYRIICNRVNGEKEEGSLSLSMNTLTALDGRKPSIGTSMVGLGSLR